MKGKIIIIEGTDCSGKQTQSERLTENLINVLNKKAIKFQFPRYDTPTGKIIGGPYLGKASICPGFFEEGASNVPGKVAALYFAADRLYNIGEVLEYVDKGYYVILDRYVESNMAYQGGKIENDKARHEMYRFLEKLEYDLLGLPKADIKIFLHMPYEYACELKRNRQEAPDQLESDEHGLKTAEKAYLEIAKMYSFKTISCVKNNKIKSIDEISKEVFDYVKEKINENSHINTL